MTTYLIIASGIVGWCSVLIFLICYAGNYNYTSKIPLIIFMIVSLTYFMYSVSKFNTQRPCVEYETRMMYNAATKTMMPARVCIERGEWINESTK